MTFTLHFRLFIYLVLGFILATVVGTLTHEYGHIVFAKMLGYKTELHYSSCSIYDGPTEINLKESFSNKTTTYNHDKLISQYNYEQTLITMSGPIQTMVTGTFGFLLLWFNRKKIDDRLTLLQWSFVFLTFFWARQIFNFLFATLRFLKTWKWSGYSDEIFIARHYQWPIWSVTFLTALTATILLITVTFRFIPKQQRFTFISAGLTGSIIGFPLWMKVIGPIILP